MPFALIEITPDPIIFRFGPIPIGWYGVAYVVGIAVMFAVSLRELERRGIERQHLWNAFFFVGVCALIGARVYHVVHEWDRIYAHNPLLAILPISEQGFGFAGLGLFGGIAGAAVGIILYGRWWKMSWHRIRLGLDAIIPGTLFAQAIARWGNFFNQELYGPPTDLPWALQIECAHRVAQYPCAAFPLETTGFHPLFFYEFLLNLTGGLLALYISRRFLPRLTAGDLTAFWGVWYGSTRFLLEFFREGWNWTLGGLATAQWVSLGVIVIGIAWIAWNHRPGRPPDPVPVDLGRAPVDDTVPASDA